jgi:hypothetical protein
MRIRVRETSTGKEVAGAMVPILLWLLGVPIGLILILLLLGVIHL